MRDEYAALACSAFLAPSSTDVTPGLRRAQAVASCPGVSCSSSATDFIFSTFARTR